MVSDYLADVDHIILVLVGLAVTSLIPQRGLGTI